MIYLHADSYGQNTIKINTMWRMDRVYLDWAATAPADFEIQRTALETSFVYPGNPSSVHTEGKRARQKIEEIRNDLGNVLNWPAEGICFTSGGTESNNIVLSSMLKKTGKPKIVSSSIEHPSVSVPLKTYTSACDVNFVPCEADGRVSEEKLAIELENAKLCTVVMASNELGTVQDFGSLTALKSSGVHFHSDIVQAIGKVPLRLDGLDSASVSAHKLGGPKGSGLLLIRKELEPLYRGGGQEFGIRPGTESVFHAMCVLEAVRKSLDGLHENITHGNYLKRYLVEELLKLDEVQLIPQVKSEEILSNKFSPFILRISIPPLPGEVIVRMFDDNGIAVSTGSACSNRKKNGNESLKAIGLSDQTAQSSIRISWGWSTRLADMQYLLKVLKEKILPAAAAIR